MCAMCRAMLGYELEHMADVFDVQQTEHNVNYDMNRFELLLHESHYNFPFT